MKKGSSIMVEGRMQTRSWDDKNSGEKKYRTEVIAERTQFGPRAAGTSGGGAPSTASKAPAGDQSGGK